MRRRGNGVTIVPTRIRESVPRSAEEHPRIRDIPGALDRGKHVIPGKEAIEPRLFRGKSNLQGGAGISQRTDERAG